MPLKHAFEPLVFKATNDTEEIKLNYSDCFPYMQHISDHHLSIFSLSVRAKLLLSSISCCQEEYTSMLDTGVQVQVLLWFYVACFGVRVSFTFHLIHMIFSSV